MIDPAAPVFILYNEHESAVEPIVRALDSRDIKTYFWKRDIPFGEGWEPIEDEKLQAAPAVLVFLGPKGWGPNHLKITEKAQSLGKRLIPILLGDPPPGDYDKASGLFRERRYVELRQLDPKILDELADQILPGRSNLARFDRIVNILIDGSEEERDKELRQLRQSSAIDREAFAARLRSELQGRIAPNSSFRQHLTSIRSWMLSSLIWADLESPESRDLILRHLDSSYEFGDSVRFWSLAGLYGRKASYLQEAVAKTLDDPAPEVAALAQAISGAGNPEVVAGFRSRLQSDDFDRQWPVLRLLRALAIPELAEPLCGLFRSSDAKSDLAYDTLYALSNPVMAHAAAILLREEPGIESVVRQVLEVARSSNPNAVRNFTSLLAAFEDPRMDGLLALAQSDSKTFDQARSLRGYLRENRPAKTEEPPFLAGYIPDSSDLEHDDLGVRMDVQTLTAVILARDVEPPLAIGLFGDWGTGKSYFMDAMIATATELAKRSASSRKFHSNIVPIKFNAWHYVDSNLWASLVSFILEELSAYVNPEGTPEGKQIKLASELDSSKAVEKAARAELEATQEVIKSNEDELARLQVQRKEKEVDLRDLLLGRAVDFKALLASDPNLEKEIKDSLARIGVDKVLDSVEDLSKVVSEAETLRGRATALFREISKSKSRAVILTLLAVLLIVFPAIIFWLHRTWSGNRELVATLAAFSAEVAAFLAAAGKLWKPLSLIKSNLEKLEKAKEKVDELIAAQRAKVTPAEEKLEKEIAGLKAKEQTALARVSAAASRVLELEEQLRALKESRSLSHFLTERTASDDYKKHLGVGSTIRKDFEGLVTRLNRNEIELGKPVDRIILFIDDLDRCPAEKVVDVLQAVHLLLAYPLFVVVVGVDPRWLLHSLGSTYSAFQLQGDGFSTQPASWRTTPQNYLEKIFQIPFNLRSMTEDGYKSFVKRLFSSSAAPVPQDGDVKKDLPNPAPGGGLENGEPRQDANPERPGPGAAPPTTPASPPAVEEPAPGAPSEFVVEEESLVIRSWESAFAEDLWELIPTPRAAKRFTNTYRILKAGVRREEIVRFEGTAKNPGEFRVPMLLLAIVIGAPAESPGLFPRLKKWAKEEGKVSIEAILGDEAHGPLEGKVRQILTAQGLGDFPKVFDDWLPRVARFSFEVGRSLAAGPTGEPALKPATRQESL